jgi:hypothetical protein
MLGTLFGPRLYVLQKKMKHSNASHTQEGFGQGDFEAVCGCSVWQATMAQTPRDESESGGRYVGRMTEENAVQCLASLSSVPVGSCACAAL